MKTNLSSCLLLALLAFGVPKLEAAQTAQARMSNASVIIRTGYCDCGFGLEFSLSFCTYYTEDPAQANGEVAPNSQPNGYSHWSWMILWDPSMYGSTTLAELNLPADTDSDADGIPDFFETGMAAAGVSYGIYHTSLGSGTGQLILHWSRYAGTGQGTCDIEMNDPELGRLGPFHCTFEVIQYNGTVSYTPGQGSISGDLNLTRASGPSYVIAGPFQFLKSNDDPANVLVLQDTTWTTTSAGPVSFTGGRFTREGCHYRGALQCDTGGFNRWTLVITDTNDADHDTIPDFSDGLVPPQPPRLTLSAGSGGLQLTITGEVGRTYLLQKAPTCDATTWETLQPPITLSAESQVLSVASSPERASFWRLQVQ